jgi:hypothetical protein
MGSETPRQGMFASKVGLMWPQSPRGKASLMDLNSEPDLTISDDYMTIGWETDPDVIREYVPEPLEVDRSGRIFLKAVARNSDFGRRSTEFISAERLTHNEVFITIPCTYKGAQYMFMPFSWGTRDWLAQAGRMVGLPHKWARVQMTTFHPFAPRYNGPHEGARVCVSVENVGLVMRAYADLKRVVPVEEAPPFARTASKNESFGLIGHRYVWDPCKRRPALNDLVVHHGDKVDRGPIWEGDAWLSFYDAENEEVMQFQPKRVIGAWWMYIRFNHSLTPPYVLHEYGDVSPYASRPKIRQLLEGIRS